MRLRAAIGLLLATCLFSPAAGAEKTRLVIWTVVNEEGMKGDFAAYRAFEAMHPGVQIHAVTVPTIFGVMDPQKLMTSIAGGSPPDIINQDRFSIGDWASRDAFLPLNDLIERDAGAPFPVREGDFYAATWAEASHAGRVYAIPKDVDNRALYYNEDILRQAGYVDDSGEVVLPHTWAELADYAHALSLWDEGGQMTRLGYAPLTGNSFLYMYGWLNGGRFMSADRTVCTLNDPPIVGALSWMKDVYDRLGGYQAVQVFGSTFQGEALDPFLTGQIAMKVDGSWYLQSILRYRPDLRFGVVPCPAPEGMEPITWAGGFSYAIPRGCRHVDEAWEFIRWMVSPEAWLLINRVQSRYDASRGRAYLPRLSANMVANDVVLADMEPENARIASSLRIFLDMMPESKFRPVTPVGQLLWDEHYRATERALYAQMTPQESLDAGAAVVQERLDELLGKTPYPPLDARVVGAAVGALALVCAGVGVARAARGPAMGRMARREAACGYLFAAPWFAGFLLLTAGPIIASFVLCFCRYDVLHPPEVAGLANFKALLGWTATPGALGEYLASLSSGWERLLFWRTLRAAFDANDPLFWRSLYNTLFMVLGVPLGMALGLGIAMLLAAESRRMSVYRTIFYIPAITPMVASSILWLWVLHPSNGLVNALIRAVDDAVPWLHLGQPLWWADAHWAKPSIILMTLWMSGASMIIWLAGLKAIPSYLYEAARIDGAGALRRFRSITLPMLSPYIFFNLIMGIIGTCQIFTQAYVMTQGGPQDATLFYVYHLFNNAFRYLKMGYASAMAWILLLVVLALTLVNFKIAPRWVYYEAEKPR